MVAALRGLSTAGGSGAAAPGKEVTEEEAGTDWADSLGHAYI